MKTRINAKPEKMHVQQAGRQQDGLYNYPHASVIKGVTASYESMYEAVQKVSHPVSFASLKVFYNI